MVWRYLRLLGCEPDLADDLSQETFLKLLKKPPQISHPAALSGYLRRLAKHLFIDEVRRRGRAVPENLDEADAVWEAAAGRDDGDEWREALRDCLDRIEGRPRRVLRLKYRDRLSIAEVADRVGMTGNGIKALLARVKQRLRACIEKKVR